MFTLRTVTAAIVSLLLMAVFDGGLLLACPASFGGLRANGCDHCPREKKTHCPIAPGEQQCPLLESDRLPAETAAFAAGPALPAAAPIALPLPTFTLADLPAPPDWHHSSDLLIRIRVLRI